MDAATVRPVRRSRMTHGCIRASLLLSAYANMGSRGSRLVFFIGRNNDCALCGLRDDVAARLDYMGTNSLSNFAGADNVGKIHPK